MDKNPYLATELKYFLHTFRRQPLLLKRARGSEVWDARGKRYLDFYSGLAVCGIGHNNDRVVRAIRRQSAALVHSSNYFYTRPQLELAKALTAKLPGSRAFFGNSGAEANEWAIKLARLWAFNNRKGGREIIGFTGSFHGRTLATLAASGTTSAANAIFKPLPPGFRHVHFNDLERLRQAAGSRTIAIILEPIQGEGGVNIASPNFLRGVARLCREKNILLIVDEVQSGMGRTGTFFAFEPYGINPDIVTLAKGLAGGLPLGATLAAPRVARFVKPGMHGSTFGGNAVACAASLEVLKLLGPQALRSIQKTGRFLMEQLAPFAQYPSVKMIRGRGLMAGIELDTSGDPYVSLARKKGLLINCTQGSVLRFLPPYFMTRKEMHKAVSILHAVFEELRRD